MKISERWLREWVNPPVDTTTLAEQLTMLGHEVDSVEPACPDLSGVVVARVTGIRPHPAADRLQLCMVDTGRGEALEVVCGAPDVRENHQYPFAGIGTTLPGGVTIQSTRIKDVVSDGMLCSPLELGLGERADSLLELDAGARPGEPLAKVLDLDDHILEVALTPNRGDCLGIRGLAREIAVLNKLSLKEPADTETAAQTQTVRDISLPAAAACPRYLGRVIEDVDVTQPSPAWLQERLRRCGIRSVGIIVDIGNFVMLELGQPMHAFDNDRLQGGISVRWAQEGERIELLNGDSHSLDTATLVIADDSGAVAMGGVMGGAASAVGDSTRNIFLECAWFNPVAVANKARQYNLVSDACHRYERGVDPTLQRRAVNRATALVLALCGGRPGPVVEAVEKQSLPAARRITLPYRQVTGLLGKSVRSSEIRAILRRLGLDAVAQDRKGVTVSVPPHRFDLVIAEDLIEEVARIHGFDRFPGERPPARLAMRPAGETGRLEELRHTLVERGYQEVITYSFVEHDLQKDLFPELDGLALLNAISTDLAVMRVSLWPGLLNTLSYNLNRQHSRVRIFELGKVFLPGERLDQATMLGGLIYGNIYPKQWGKEDTSSNLFDMKMDLEALLRQYAGARPVGYEQATANALHPGQTAKIRLENQAIGLAGQLHPGIARRLDIDGPVYLFAINLDRISPKSPVKYVKISKFPTVRRDISFLIDEKISVATVLASVKKLAINTLSNLELFDVYQGEGIDLGKKSVTLGLTFQESSRTLTDEEVEGVMGAIIQSLQKEFNARLR